MPFDNTAKNLMLDELATLAVVLRLHTADPGATNSNPTTAADRTVVWASAVGGDLALSTNYLFTGGAASGPVLWFSVWNTGATIRYGKAQITTGDVAFNVSGEYTLTTGTRLRITDS